MRAPTLVIHCDWSVAPNKRWLARATLSTDGYRIEAPAPVGVVGVFLEYLLTERPGPTLAGFDFPIGLPKFYGERTGFKSFREALLAFGAGNWARWFDVAERKDQISLRRPFYPLRPGGTSQAHLIDSLGAESMDELRRVCELRNAARQAACSLFWTLGGNQVGKAAISGWRELVVPALASPRISLWPFDGQLSDLLARGGTTIAETYPGDAYGQVGIRFRPGMSKRRQSDRLTFAQYIEDWAERRGHTFDPALTATIRNGFGLSEAGEDPFDAFLGLCGMLEVVGGHRAEGSATDLGIEIWEGWILGQRFEPTPRPASEESAKLGRKRPVRPGEFELIARHFAPLAGPGALGLTDDAAFLRPSPGHDLVLTADAVVADVHYLGTDPPASIARKALTVNLSDLAAKGAAPRGFLLTLALADDWNEAWLAGFAEGLGEAADDFGCTLLGGDTVRANGATLVSITAIGEVPEGRMVKRRGAQPGDRLFVTGTIGDAALGLRVLRGEGAALSEEDRAFLIDRYRHPQPRLALIEALRLRARAAMDVSDGLVGDLAKMLEPGLSATVPLDSVPLSPAARRFLALQPALLESVLTGGDDYEILCAIPPENAVGFAAAAANTGIGASEIGAFVEGDGSPRFLDGDGVERTFAAGSFSHF